MCPPLSFQYQIRLAVQLSVFLFFTACIPGLSSFFSGGFLSSYCFSFSSSCSSLFLSTSTTTTFGFASFFTIRVKFVEVNKLNHTHFSVITKTVTSLDNTGVSTWTIAHLSRYFSEKLSYSVLIF